MQKAKPPVDQAEALSFIQRTFSESIYEITPINEGQIAQTFSLKNTDQPREYILRFTDQSIGLLKEAYIYQHFASPSFPMPRILATGTWKDLYYVISEKVAGVSMSQLSLASLELALPQIILTLQAIHATSVTFTTGYGNFNEQGIGMAKDWPSYLRSVREEEVEESFYGKWHSLFETTFLEKVFFDYIYDQMESLLVYCPTERFLIHGGYGYGNLMLDTQNNQVTGVIDWADAKFGDFLYDVVWLDFWSPSPDIDFIQLFRDYYVAQEIPVVNFTERVLCYACFIGLDALRFFAKKNDLGAYEYTCTRLQSLLSKTRT
jgi:hygromycin-B 4-O-kinase